MSTEFLSRMAELIAGVSEANANRARFEELYRLRTGCERSNAASACSAAASASVR